MVAVHSDSPENELITLRNRVLMAVPRPEGEALSTLAGVRAHLASRLIKEMGGMVGPWSRAKSAQHFIERKGWGLYGPAWKSLEGHPIGTRDMEVEMFLKAEKWPVQAGESLKEARAIQFRGPRYNIELGRFLLPFEAKLWDLLQVGLRVRDDVFLYSSKGLSPNKRAALLEALWEKYPGGRALCLDHSRFDAHLSEEVLKEEHLLYKTACSGGRLLEWLLKGQCKTRGRTKHGRRYACRGGRMSGDVNTALGNTCVSGMLLLTVAGDFTELSILVEGDDGVVFGPGEEIARLERLIEARMLTLGFELKVAVARCLEEVDYCSGRAVRGGPGEVARWARAWPRPFATDPWTPKAVQGKRAPREKAYSMALGAWVQYRGVPVYQAWGEWLLSHIPPSKYDAWYERDVSLRLAPVVREWSEGLDWQGVPFSPALRASFAAATGVGATAQDQAERWFRCHLGPYPSTPPRGTDWSWACSTGISL